MNVIYYDRLLQRTEWWDRWLRITSLVLASGGVAAALKYLTNPAWAILVGCVAALLSAITLIFRLPDKARAAATMLPQYVKLTNTLEKLFAEFQVAPDEAALDPKPLGEALAALDDVQVVEAEKIPGVHERLRLKAHAQLMREIEHGALAST